MYICLHFIFILETQNGRDIEDYLTPLNTVVAQLSTDELTLSKEQISVSTKSPMRVHIRTPTHSPSHTAMNNHVSSSHNLSSARTNKVFCTLL